MLIVGTTTNTKFQPVWSNNTPVGPTMNEAAGRLLVGKKNSDPHRKDNKYRLFKIITVTTIEEIPV